jgi:hypothetical protein
MNSFGVAVSGYSTSSSTTGVPGSAQYLDVTSHLTRQLG